jgi:hypothetical protein
VVSLLDVLLSRIEPEKKTFAGTLPPSPPSSPSEPKMGDDGGEGEDIWRKVLSSMVAKPYAEHMQAALRKINSPAYPAGMILWLEKAAPELYADLTERLPDEIHRLWEAFAPLGQFDETLVRLVSQHRRASVLFRAYLASRDGENGGKS